jgi:hypothetical protein
MGIKVWLSKYFELDMMNISTLVDSINRELCRVDGINFGFRVI